MPLENVPDMSGRKRIRITVNSAYEMTSNSLVNKLFSQNSHFSFQIGECGISEAIFTKGHEADPANGSWAIINQNGHLKIILHEQNLVNSLVFLSSSQILNSYYRNLISINWNNTTKSLTVFVNGIEQSITIDTSQPNYRTSTSSFTGLNVTSDPIKIGRGSVTPNGTFSIYYDNGEQKILTQPEIADYWNTIKDERGEPELGRIIFGTSRTGLTTPSLYEMFENGSDPVLKAHTSYNVGAVAYSHYEEGSYDTFGYASNVAYEYGEYYVDGVRRVFTSNTDPNGFGIAFKNNNSLLYYVGSSGSGDIKVISLTTYTETNLNTNTNYGVRFVTTNKVNDYIYNARYNTNIIQRTISSGATSETLFTAPAGSTNAILALKCSNDGTKLGFTTYRTYSSGVGYSGVYSAYIDLTTNSIIELGDNIFFECFSPNGNEFIYSKQVSGAGYTNKWHLFKRNLITNLETQLTFGNHNNRYADWKA